MVAATTHPLPLLPAAPSITRSPLIAGNHPYDDRRRRTGPTARAGDTLSLPLVVLSPSPGRFPRLLMRPRPPLEITDADIDSASPATRHRPRPEVTRSCSPSVLHRRGLLRLELPGAAAEGRIPTCSITVPDCGYGDLQRTAEYVVASVRRMSRESGRTCPARPPARRARRALGADLLAGRRPQGPDLISLATPYNGTSQPRRSAGTARLRGGDPSDHRGLGFIAALAARRFPTDPSSPRSPASTTR